MDGRGQGDAGPSGFRNVEPQSRHERMASRDKDLLEKSRLQARNRGVLQPPENFLGSPVVPQRNTPAYCDEYDRFNRDTAGQLNQEKQQSMQRKEEVYAARRAENYQREKGYFESMQAEQAREAAKYDAARTGGTGARRNAGSEAYNIISLNGGGGTAQDLASQERRDARTTHLYTKSHSVAHNIITGEPMAQPRAYKQ